jgi:hypothetical protein
MKIEIRVVLPPTKDGSSTSITLTTRPSAGAMTTLSPRGPSRTGSLKKATTHTAITAHSTATYQGVSHARRTVMSHAPMMNGHPSGATRITAPPGGLLP